MMSVNKDLYLSMGNGQDDEQRLANSCMFEGLLKKKLLEAFNHVLMLVELHDWT